MSCKYELCKDWSWDGCPWSGVHDYSGSKSNLPVWSCNGRCCNGVTSYSTRGDCEDTQLIAYEKPNYSGFSQPMRGHNKRVNRVAKPGCNEDWWASIKETKIPKTMSGKLDRVDTDAECHGADATYKKVAGKINACFYSDSDESKIRKVYDQKTGNTNMSALFTTLRDNFCAKSNNVFKNPGSGTCLEYDKGKNLAKEYCSVGNRMAADTNCSEANLGPTFYAELAEAYCKTTAGRADEWCSCYNVANDVCKTHPTATGCAKKKQVFDPLVEATPEKFRHVWSGKAKCFGSVCVGKKYVPTNANQGCDAPIQICAQSFDLSNISESTIEAKCEQKAVQNITPPGTPTPPSTQPSAGDSPSGSVPAPSGSSPTPSGDVPAMTPSGEIDLEKLTDTQKLLVALIAVILCFIFVSMIF